MKPFFILLLFIFGFSTKSYCQAELSRTDSIELAYEQCVDTAYGSYDYDMCYFDRMDAWDKELNNVYQKILPLLSASTREKFRASQRKWVEYKNLEVSFAAELYDNEEGWTREKFRIELELTRTRTLQLQEYYSHLTAEK
jgi:uncharacterized protein YecT (DUF1311 family)